MKTINKTLFYVGIVLALAVGVFMIASLGVSTVEAWGSGDYGSGCCEEGGSGSDNNDSGKSLEADDVKGCKDPAATNYNPAADKDNGSCVYPAPKVLGCTDSAATNYNPSADQNNGSCQYPVEEEEEVIKGCTDADAINYNPEATESNESCEYQEEEVLIDGCTDADAINYNPEANVSNESCEYEEEEEEEEEEETYHPVIPACTFDAGEDTVIVTFSGEKLRTSDGLSASLTEKAEVDLAAGSYDVFLMSWDGFSGRVNVSQPNEQWQLQFLNGDTIVAASGHSTDLADNVIEDTKIDDVNRSLEIPGHVTSVRGVHPYYPSQSANSLYPVCAAIVNVTPEVEPTPTPTCELGSTKSVITAGDSTQLNWTTTNATRVVLTGGNGDVGLTGSTTVSPLQDFVYQLTAFGEEETQIACETTIQVTEVNPEVVLGCTDATATNYNAQATQDDGSCEYPTTEVLGCTDIDATNYNDQATQDDNSCTYPTTTSSSGGGGSSSPRCELEVSDATITAGQTITLTWDTRRARDITLADDNGNVLLSTEDMLSDDKDDLLDSSFEVSPTSDTVYTLTAERGSRDRDCSVEVAVEGEDIVILEVRDQAPLVAGISLSEVPYTGFEAGPMMTTLFYTLLAAWALYLTYVLVIPKNTLQVATVAAAVSPAEQMKQAEAVRPDAFGSLPTAPVVASTATAVAPANLPVAPVAPQMTVAPVSPTMPAVATASTPVDVAAIEAIAHNNQTLLSSDAIQTFILSVPTQDQLNKIVAVVTAAKAQFPLEDGWVVVNNDRMMTLLAA